jgi:hypothetical protein
MKIAFFKSRYGRPYDYYISVLTLSTYCHAELIFSDNMWFSCSSETGGAAYQNYYKDPKYKPYQWEILTLKITEKEEQIIRDWCNKMIGNKFDWKGFFPMFLYVIKQKNGIRFCSEICTEALQQILPLGLNSHLTSPGKLRKKLIKKEFVV